MKVAIIKFYSKTMGFEETGTHLKTILDKIGITNYYDSTKLTNKGDVMIDLLGSGELVISYAVVPLSQGQYWITKEEELQQHNCQIDYIDVNSACVKKDELPTEEQEILNSIEEFKKSNASSWEDGYIPFSLNPKGDLQIFAQKNRHPDSKYILPYYVSDYFDGEFFYSTVQTHGIWTAGKGRNKKNAEKQASDRALRILIKRR